MTKQKCVTYKWILFAIILLKSTVSFAQQLHYTFVNKMSDASPYIHVVVGFKQGQTGTVLLNLPSEYAGQKKLYNCIKNLRCESLNAKIDSTSISYKKILTGTANTNIKISYDIVPDFTGDISWPKYFRPIIKNDCFYMLGLNCLVTPDMPTKERLKVRITWDGFDEKKLVNSFGAGKNDEHFITDEEQLQNAVFSGGNLRVLPVMSKTNPVLVAVYGEFKFSDDTLNRFVTKVINNERDFWNDHNYPYYLVTVFPCFSDTYGGSGYTNTFCIFYRPQLQLTEGLAGLLYHEYFHNWNGQKIQRDSAGEYTYAWFAEGFTQYYQQKLSVRDGLQTKEDDIKYVNSVFQSLYLSTARHANNHFIETEFWNNTDVKNLAYQRGYFFALLCDNEIRKESKSVYSLDDVMKEILKTAQLPTYFSSNIFFAAVKKFYNGKIIAEQYQQMIIEGKDPKVDLLVDKDKYTDTVKTFNVIDVGFDRLMTAKYGKITGLKAGSPAEKAGLRECMLITGSMSIWLVDPDKEVKVEIKEGDSTRWIRYFPAGTTKTDIPYIIQQTL